MSRVPATSQQILMLFNVGLTSKSTLNQRFVLSIDVITVEFMYCVAYNAFTLPSSPQFDVGLGLHQGRLQELGLWYAHMMPKTAGVGGGG